MALTAGAISLVLGMLLMLGRVSKIKPLSAACRVVIDFFRGVPSLLLIYFFFLVVRKFSVGLEKFPYSKISEFPDGRLHEIPSVR